MNKGYVAFIGVLAVLWLITLILDVIMTASIYSSRFQAIANVTSSIGSQFRTPIYVIIGLPEAIGLFFPPLTVKHHLILLLQTQWVHRGP